MRHRILTARLDDDPDAYDAQRRSYESQLQRWKPVIPKDLWRFFAWNFFHDGVFEACAFDARAKTASWRITCPNIEKQDNTGSSFKVLQFVCHFTGVSSLRFPCVIDPLLKPTTPTFLYGEIVVHDHKLRPFSLFLDLDPGHAEITFRNLQVRAVDTVRFDAILADPSYRMPIRLD